MGDTQGRECTRQRDIGEGLLDEQCGFHVSSDGTLGQLMP